MVFTLKAKLGSESGSCMRQFCDAGSVMSRFSSPLMETEDTEPSLSMVAVTTSVISMSTACFVADALAAVLDAEVAVAFFCKRISVNPRNKRFRNRSWSST